MQKNYKILFVILCFIAFALTGCVSDPDSIGKVLESGGATEPVTDISSEDSAPVLESTEMTNSRIVVNVDVLRLRSGPGTDYEIIDRLELGTILDVIGEQGEWLNVGYREGWVHGDYVIKSWELSDPSKIYEVISAQVQPVGYSKQEIASFVENATTFNYVDFALPVFRNPNEMENDDLILAITLGQLVPKYIETYRHNYSVISGVNLQETARSIFGPDLKDIEHRTVFPYLWYSDDQVYRVEAFGPGSYSETKVIDVVEAVDEFFVDVVHLFYYYDPEDEEYISYVAGENTKPSTYENYNDFYEHAIVLIDEQHEDGTIDNYLETFPIRRYILSKDGNGICYIRQSFLLDNE